MKPAQKIVSVCILALFSSLAGAEINIMKEMVSVKGKIEGLDTILAAVKKETGVTPVFPAFIPKTDKKYYASKDSADMLNGFTYRINVDSTPDCNGIKYCNIGMVTAHPNAKIDKMKDRHNKVITVPVGLADGTTAYYTPGHAMADYFPANIQWVENKVLYTISWNGVKSAKIEREALITMANSAKNPGSG